MIFTANLILLLASDIKIPVWLFSLMLPLLVSILGIVISNIKSSVKEISTISTSIQSIDKRLTRIEDNFDNHILKSS
jgi:hypothetical protein